MKSDSKNKVKLIQISKTLLIPFLSLIVIILVFVYSSFNARSNRVFSSFFYRYKIGDIVEEDVYSPLNKEVVDEKATQKIKDEALLTVSPIFDINIVQSEQDLTTLSNLLEKYKARNRGQLSNNIQNIYEYVSLVLSFGYFDKQEIQDISQKGYKTIKIQSAHNDGFQGSSTYPISQCITEDNIHTMLNVYLKNQKFTELDQEFIEEILSSVYPNVRLNYIQTSKEMNNVLSSVEPVTKHISEGDIVVYKDSIVTRETIDTLINLSEVTDYNTVSKIIIKSFMLIVMSVILYLLLSRYLKKNIRKNFFINLIYVSMAIYVLLLNLLSYIFKIRFLFAFDLLMPQFIVPILVFNLSNDYKLSIYSLFYFALTMMFFQFSGQFSLIRHLMSGLTFLTFFNYSNTRLKKMLSYFCCFIFEGLFTTLSLVLEGYFISSLITGLEIWAMVFVVGSSLTIFITYMTENAFNLATYNKLEELTYRANPLLTEFERSCPGSYVHSVLVSKISVSAAEVLKLNVPLVRLSAMYHDIGKMEHPQYFIENQIGINNKHDKINNLMSVSLIKSHVTFSVSMLKKARFPQEVIDIVSQHHGNDTINYFYYEAQREAIKQGGDAEDINQSDYAYDFSPPTSKEAGVIMLADISEAATRSFISSALSKSEKVSEASIKNLIHDLFIQKIETHQLSSSGLTIGDIEKLEDIYTSKIAAENHSRIEYKKVE